MGKLTVDARGLAAIVILARRQRGVTEADRFLVNYPRAGSTWLRFLLHDVLFGELPDFAAVNQELPTVGRHRRARASLPHEGRLVCTHHVWSRLRLNLPFVYLVRDPRATVLSYHHYLTGAAGSRARTIDETIDLFLSGRIDNHGAWPEHVRSALGEVDAGRAHLVRYEDLVRDPVGELGGVLDFLDVDRSMPDLVRAVSRNTRERLSAVESQTPHLQGMSSPFIGIEPRSVIDVELSSGQRARIESACTDEISRLGYTT